MSDINETWRSVAKLLAYHQEQMGRAARVITCGPDDEDAVRAYLETLPNPPASMGDPRPVLIVERTVPRFTIYATLEPLDPEGRKEDQL